MRRTTAPAGPASTSVYTTRPDGHQPRRLRAELAQLDRASVYETEGRRFDSCIPRHFPPAIPYANPPNSTPLSSLHWAGTGLSEFLLPPNQTTPPAPRRGIPDKAIARQLTGAPVGDFCQTLGALCQSFSKSHRHTVAIGIKAIPRARAAASETSKWNGYQSTTSAW
jgi:hypothetical protein